MPVFMRAASLLLACAEVAHCFAPPPVRAGGMTLRQGGVTGFARTGGAAQRGCSRHVVLASSTQWFGDTPYGAAPGAYHVRVHVHITRARPSTRRPYTHTHTHTGAEALAFDSTYLDKTGQPRGFCNWVVPGKVMSGRYPHGTPVS